MSVFRAMHGAVDVLASNGIEGNDPTFSRFSIEHRLVTDGRTVGQTQDDGIYHASIALRGKKT